MSVAQAEKAIGRIVDRLVRSYAPERVVLFGSYAYGTPNEDSDIDLLIVKDTVEPFFDRMVTVRELVSDLRRGLPFDPIVLTPKELNDRLHIGDQFLGQILEEGKTLYAA